MRNLTITIDKFYNLIPDIGDKQYLSELIKPNQVLECKLIKSRNLLHHRKYWSLLNALEFHFGNTAEAWHMYFKEKFLPLTEFIMPDGTKRLYPSSTSFEKMNQIEFNEYYDKVDKHLINCGYTIEELLDTMGV